MRDGLYQVTTKHLCAGFLISNGNLVACAPRLRQNILFYFKIAKRIEHHDRHRTTQHRPSAVTGTET